MFLLCIWLCLHENCLRTDWLMSQGSLRQLVPLFENAVAFENLLRLDQCFKKSFIMFCLYLFCCLTSIFTFQTALQTLDFFLFFACFLWLSVASLTSLLFISISSSVLLIKAAIALSSSLSLFCLGVKKMPSLWLCLSTCQKDLLSSSTQFLSMKGSKAVARVVAKAVPECCDSKVNTTEGGDAQPVILKKNSKTKKKSSGSKANLSVISVTFVVSWKKSLPTTTFLVSSFISHSLFHFFFSKMSLAHVYVAPPCLWVVIDLLDFSLSSPFPSEVLSWTSHCPQDPWKQVNTVVVVHSFHCVLYHPVQHVSSCTRPSSYFFISHSLWSYCSIVCCCNRNSLSRKSSSRNTQTTLFTTPPLLPRRSSFAVAKKGRTKWFLKSLLILEPQQQRKVLAVDCPWITAIFTKSTSPSRSSFIFSHCFCPDKFHLSVHHFSWNWSHLVT